MGKYVEVIVSPTVDARIGGIYGFQTETKFVNIDSDPILANSDDVSGAQ